MENDSPNLFDSEPVSVRLDFPEKTGGDEDDVLADILEEIREDDDHRRPPVVENTATDETEDSDVDDPPPVVDAPPGYHTDDSDDDGSGTADDPPADVDLDQSTGSPKDASPKAKDVHKGLPTGRVKLIMKMDPDVNIVAGDAVFVLTKATESFVGLLAQHSHKAMMSANKKTLQKKHIDSVIEDNVPFEFLEGALDW